MVEEAEPTQAPRASLKRRVLQAGLSAAVVVAIFAFALPKLADYSKVWSHIGAMSWLELATLALVAAWNIVTYWLVMVAALPGSNYWQAMKVNQASTAIANTFPGGGAIGIGVTYGMYTSYGFSRTEIGLAVLVTGIWNNFVKLGMPIVALAFLAIQGNASGALLAAALIGVGALAAAIVLFALVMRSDALARAVGVRLGTVVSFLRRLLRKSEGPPLGEATVRFRRHAAGLIGKRWLRLTLATTVSHVSLYLVLLIALRHVGVGGDVLGWAEVLAAFSFVRLLSAIPITPGGLGVVELGLIAGLASAGGPRARVAAAVLIYRALTYLLPIPLGIAAYLEFRRGAEARRERVAAAAEARLGEGVEKPSP